MRLCNSTAGGVGLLVPALTSYAAGLLASVMAAAALTLMLHGERAAPPLVDLVLVLLIGWLRRRSAWRPRRDAPRVGALI